MIANYHTHTYRCHHAGAYEDEEYVKYAIDNGFRVLGFSDHTPWPYITGYRSPVRMDVLELDAYISSVQKLKEKYRDIIHIYIGLECEYFPEYLPWLEQQRHKLDYLILGSHWAPSDEHGEVYYSHATQPEQVEEYADFTICGMQTGLFSYLAHPDHVFSDYPTFDGVCRKAAYAICEEAKRVNLPLEYNLVGYEKKLAGRQKGLGFPTPEFWDIAEEVGCSAILGIDAHKPGHFSQHDWINLAKQELNRRNIPILSVLPNLD